MSQAALLGSNATSPLAMGRRGLQTKPEAALQRIVQRRVAAQCTHRDGRQFDVTCGEREFGGVGDRLCAGEVDGVVAAEPGYLREFSGHVGEVGGELYQVDLVDDRVELRYGCPELRPRELVHPLGLGKRPHRSRGNATVHSRPDSIRSGTSRLIHFGTCQSALHILEVPGRGRQRIELVNPQAKASDRPRALCDRVLASIGEQPDLRTLVLVPLLIDPAVRVSINCSSFESETRERQAGTCSESTD